MAKSERQAATSEDLWPADGYPAERGHRYEAGWRWAREARLVLMMASDTAALLIAATAGYFLWALPVRHQSASLYLTLTPLLLLFVLGYAQAGTYPGIGLGPVETLRRLSLATTSAFVVLATLSFAFKLPYLYSRATFAIAFALSLVTVPLLRTAVVRGARHWSGWREPAVLVGSRGGLAGAAAAIARPQHLDYRPVGALAIEAPTGGGERIEPGGLPALGGLAKAPELARAGVTVALVNSSEPEVAGLLDELQRHFRQVVLLREFDGLPVEGVQVHNLGGVLGIEYTNNLLRLRNRAIKRAVDLALGGAALLLAAPVIAAVVLAVKLSSRGPAFFAQERAGLDGRPIRVFKVRTMHADAERRLAAHLAARPELQREWNERFKLRDDPRLIPVLGPFLRRFSLDELPQLASVVRGDMSLVGPRPFPAYHLARFPEEFRRLRVRVRPGITGLWQVTVRSEGTIAEQQAYDSYYIRNWSLWLDLYLLGRTLGAVVSGRGAY